VDRGLALGDFGLKDRPLANGVIHARGAKVVVVNSTVLTRTTAEAKPRSAPVSTRGKERKMLSATLGMLAMLPSVFGVAGYAMVSR
jgi:hypothetical protein